jgi:hypothetical protein
MAILYHWTGFPILTAASISDIIQYLSIMINKCLKVCQRLNSYKKKVEENRSDLDDPDAMLNYIQFFLGVAENYSNEIERLSSDLKSSVEKEHIISFQRLLDDCYELNDYCKGFKFKHIERKLKEEKFRYLVDDIYGVPADLMYEFRVCGEIKRRLEVLVGSKSAQYKDDTHLIQPETIEDPDDFVRNLRVSYESDTEIKIKKPPKKAKNFTYDDLGFKDNEVWKAFIYTIKEPPHIYETGPAHIKKGREKERNSQYDTKMGRIRSINKKLIVFFNKECGAQLPEDFKLYEPRKEEGKGKYKFKFQVSCYDGIEEDYYSKYEQYSKDELVDEVKTLMKKYAVTEDQVILEKVVVASNVARASGFLSDDEVNKMFNLDSSRWSSWEKKEYPHDDLRDDDLHEV